MIKNRNIDKNAYIDPTKIAMPFGFGEVYHVVRSADTALVSWLQARVPCDHLFLASTAAADIAINAALAKCVAGRNDTVIIWPSGSDYDLVATLTVSAKCTHVICPAGLGLDVGANNAVRLHQNTADTPIFTVTGASCEIAGFYFKNAASTAATGATIYAPSGGGYLSNIHHNHFGIVLSGGTNSPMIAGANDGLLYSTISRNRFLTTSGVSATIAAMILVLGPATGVNVDNNEFTVGNTCTAVTLVNNQSVMGSIKFNTAHEAGAQAGGMGAGVITDAFTINTSGAAIGNRGAVIVNHLIAGGTASQSFSDNWDGITTTPIVVVA